VILPLFRTTLFTKNKTGIENKGIYHLYLLFLEKIQSIKKYNKGFSSCSAVSQNVSTKPKFS